MKKFSLIPCLILALLSLSNCSYISGDITTFSDGFAVEPGTKIAVVAINSEQEDSVEFKGYRNLLAKYLAQHTFNIVNVRDDTAEMIAILDYAIDKGKTISYISYEPVNKVKGYVDETVGYHEYDRYYQRTEKRPITELEFEKVYRTKFVYTASISIEIKKVNGNNVFEQETKKAQPVYSAKIITQSSCNRLNLLVPKMLEMYFRKFPRENASTNVEEIKFTCN